MIEKPPKISIERGTLDLCACAVHLNGDPRLLSGANFVLYEEYFANINVRICVEMAINRVTRTAESTIMDLFPEDYRR